MKIGRIGICATGVIVGDVQSPEFITVSNSQELFNEVDKYDFVVVAGLMNTVFGEDRMIKLFMEEYGDDVATKVISGANVSINDNEDIDNTSHLFGEIKDGKATVWSDERMSEWDRTIRFKCSRTVTESIVDYIKTSCSDAREAEIKKSIEESLTKIRNVVIKDMDAELDNASEVIEKITRFGFRASSTMDKFCNMLRLKASMESGKSVYAGLGGDQGLKLRRYDNGYKFAELAEGYYKINLCGFMNRLRFENHETIEEFANRVLGREVKDAFQQLFNTRSPLYRKSLEMKAKLYSSIKREGLFKNPVSIAYMEAEISMIDFVKDKIDGAAIIEVGPGGMMFAFPNEVPVEKAMETLEAAADEFMKNMFYEFQVFENNRRVKVTMTNRTLSVAERLAKSRENIANSKKWHKRDKAEPDECTNADD